MSEHGVRSEGAASPVVGTIRVGRTDRLCAAIAAGGARLLSCSAVPHAPPRWPSEGHLANLRSHPIGRARGGTALPRCDLDPEKSATR
jgi:hypothetical protein